MIGFTVLLDTDSALALLTACDRKLPAC